MKKTLYKFEFSAEHFNKTILFICSEYNRAVFDSVVKSMIESIRNKISHADLYDPEHCHVIDSYEKFLETNRDRLFEDFYVYVMDHNGMSIKMRIAQLRYEEF